MKVFKDFKSATNWIKNSIQKGSDDAVETISEQIYKDSNDFTYRESGTMYQSGEMHSKFYLFGEGYVIERTPYVRRRYYEGGTPGAGNRQAQPRWFDKTFAKYKKDYQQMYVNAIVQALKKG